MRQANPKLAVRRLRCTQLSGASLREGLLALTSIDRDVVQAVDTRHAWDLRLSYALGRFQTSAVKQVKSV